MIREFVTHSKRRFVRSLYEVGYRSLVASGAWQSALVRAVELGTRERALEIDSGIGGVSADLAASHPTARVCRVQYGAVAAQSVASVGQLTFANGRIDCAPSSFDKAICTLALHKVPDDDKLGLLREIRRVLRQNGTLLIAELDQGSKAYENLLLRAAATQYGLGSVRAHLDANWLNLVRQAGFTSLKRLEDFSITIGRIALIRARRV